MKYLLVLLVLVVAVGIWRGKRRAEAEARSPATAPPNKPQTMVACAHCGLHLPQAEAVSDGAGRFFCSLEHRQAAARADSAH
ncbi:PP0621 family protein [Comamonas guangdongensis]|uniref:PP0621 family protein n=1 Tax=Comamonas guangdongensis TaxID=510515 RepID=A0ABV3ZVI3_9BURK